jgi:hypothetical protein
VLLIVATRTTPKLTLSGGDAVSLASRHRVDFLQVEVSRVASNEGFFIVVNRTTKHHFGDAFQVGPNGFSVSTPVLV